MADSIGTVTVDVVPRLDKTAWSEYLDSITGDAPMRVRLDDDSVDRLATAIADKLTASAAAQTAKFDRKLAAHLDMLAGAIQLGES